MLHGHRDLKVFQLAYSLAMDIFRLSKAFPREELYSLTKFGDPLAVLRRISLKDFGNEDIQIILLVSSPTAMQKRPKRRCGSILRSIVVIYPKRIVSA